ncbi:MAG: hypothetical protein HFG97_08820 [Dorea sp.]|nr:hypothetical protein [Dorea sp.]
MGRSREEQARMEGMAQALRIAKDKGVEGLEEEIRVRNITGLPCAVSKKALDECIVNIKENTIDTVLILAAYVLHWKFGWGKIRLERFIQEFNFQAECLTGDYCSWDDLRQEMRSECGIELDIRKNDRNVRVR